MVELQRDFFSDPFVVCLRATLFTEKLILKRKGWSDVLRNQLYQYVCQIIRSKI